MRFISLFSGIGGMDLGLERAGWECVAQVENDNWCNRVLSKHWPEVPRWKDIYEVDATNLPNTDAIVGGFPCQPVSLAGKRLGDKDPRWLWPEFHRLVSSIRPKIVVVENVPGLVSKGLAGVLGDLSNLGYGAEWTVIPAAAVGAPHLRKRIFIVAYPFGARVAPNTRIHKRSSGKQSEEVSASVFEGKEISLTNDSIKGSSAMDYTKGCWWGVEPSMGRVAYGVPGRVDRLRGLGNAVVPQVAEWVGNRINNSIRMEG